MLKEGNVAVEMLRLDIPYSIMWLEKHITLFDSILLEVDNLIDECALTKSLHNTHIHTHAHKSIFLVEAHFTQCNEAINSHSTILLYESSYESIHVSILSESLL